MRRLALVVFLLCSLTFGSARRTGSHPPKYHSSKTKASKTKTAHVRGYSRKDGTYVAPYDRSPSGTTPDIVGQSYRKNHLAEGFSAHPSVARDAHGKIKRSRAAKDAFERQSPCPANRKTSGRCPGYVVDHVKPLECGGADAPSNMQWQTVTDGKAKDKTERYCLK